MNVIGHRSFEMGLFSCDAKLTAIKALIKKIEVNLRKKFTGSTVTSQGQTVSVVQRIDSTSGDPGKRIFEVGIDALFDRETSENESGVILIIEVKISFEKEGIIYRDRKSEGWLDQMVKDVQDALNSL